MTDTTIAVYIPASLFQKLKRAADITHRSVEEVAITSLEAALPSAPTLPSDLDSELAALHLFSDEALWAATAPSFSPTEEYRLNQLNAVAGERDMTAAEEAEQQGLIASYHRSVLRRAKAFAILAQRGHRIPVTAETATADHDES